MSYEEYEIDYGGAGYFSEMEYKITITRTGNTILVTVIIPGVVVCLLGLLYFLMPRGNGERVPYLSTVILTEIMFLVMLTQFVPLSNEVPIVEMLFLGLSVTLCVLAIPVTLIEMKTKKNE